MERDGQDGYVMVEAVVLLPLASILILMLVYLGSFLYQGTFLMQSAYTAAFRGSRYPQRKEAYVQEQLDELLDREVLRFAAEERKITLNPVQVQVSLQRETPFSGFSGAVKPLDTTQKAMIRDAAAYIRGVRRIKTAGME